VAWYLKHLDVRADDGTGVIVGNVRLRFRKAATAAPTAGSVVDHLAFSVRSLDTTVAALRAAGLRVDAAPRDRLGLPASFFVHDPWGTRIEVLQDQARLGLHHVHVMATNPEATLAWVAETFGGSRSSADHPAVDFDGALVVVERASGTPVPSAKSVMDHLGWVTPNVSALAADLKQKGVKFTIEPRTTGGQTMAFVEGPDGLRAELLQR
jgi:catechol 2,3-dioxygenase-like lactoylglutathione lyase family enzyme